jgi:hypothetical protein
LGAEATAIVLLLRHEDPEPPIVSTAPDIVLAHAPILLLARHEGFVPIDVAAYVKKTTLLDVDPLPPDPRRPKVPRALAVRDERGSVELVGLPTGSPSCVPEAAECHYALKVPAGRGPSCVTLARRVRLVCMGRLRRYVRFQTTMRRHGALRTVYWREIEQGGRVVGIQYWFFYVFNRWLNWHEGDWEQITLRFEGGGRMLAGYSAHKHGHRQEIAKGNGAEGTHPLVYVARGSHANYFSEGPHEVNEVPGALKKLCRPLPRKHDPCLDHSNGRGRTLIPSDYRLVEIGGADWPRFAGDYGAGNFSAHGLKCLPRGGCFGYSLNVRDPTNAGDAWDAPLKWLNEAPPPPD